VRWLAVVSAAGILFAASSGQAQPLVPAGGTLYNVPVKSLVEMRFENVVPQAHDLSCGAAAMATLLKYYYHEDIDEQEIIDAIFEFGDEEKISRDGFSMLELKKYAEKKRYNVQGFLLKDVNVLSKVDLPFIALINVGTYLHFVVVRGVDGGTVFIADPAFGNLRVDLDQFARAWKKKTAFFVVEPEVNAEIARTSTIPDRVRMQTLGFVDAGRVLSARSQDVWSLVDNGLRPLQPSAGSFQ
jgi:predicted double-glycine peptidase